MYKHVSMPICLDLCFHMLVCLDLCSLHALCHLSCARALHAMFMCLDLGYVCHAMCYNNPFCRFVFLSCVLAYWFGPDLDPMVGPDLDPMVFVIVYTNAYIKGFRSPYFSCLCLLASMLYACVSLSSSRLCHT